MSIIHFFFFPRWHGFDNFISLGPPKGHNPSLNVTTLYIKKWLQCKYNMSHSRKNQTKDTLQASLLKDQDIQETNGEFIILTIKTAFNIPIVLI